MTRIVTGGIMILFVVVTNIMVAYVTTAMDGDARAEAFTAAGSGCQQQGGGNESGFAEDCRTASKTSFAWSLAQVTVSGIEGAPTVFNVFYVTVMLFVLTLGVIVFLWGLVPLTAE